jgi:hypothetical protein
MVHSSMICHSKSPCVQSDGTSEVSEDYREEGGGRRPSGCSSEAEGDSSSSFWELYHSTRRTQINFHEDSASGKGYFSTAGSS